MPIKYVSYVPNTVEGQAVLDNFVRNRRVLRYNKNNEIFDRIVRGLPLYELEKIEEVRLTTKNTENVQSTLIDETNAELNSNLSENKNLVIRGECISACAYLKENGIKVDLVYIDPPFASGADYAKKVYIRRNPKLAEKIAKAEEELEIDELRSFEEKMYGDIWNKEDYLNWMYENLMAIKSIMSDTASIYVHLDWHIGHYVKILMDEVFGESNFRNEIIWCYNGPSVIKNAFPRKHDVIFFYSKNEDNIFNGFFVPHKSGLHNTGQVFGDMDNEDIDRVKELMDRGKMIEDWWSDLYPVDRVRSEIMDYSTQKPEALLERIIQASSNEGMLVADFFGGSGVAAKVASDLKRNFIHVDVGINSIQTTRDRLKQAGAEFDILDVQDGVSLFRNPVQTMDKLKKLITGLKNEDSLDSFWEGAINDSKLGMLPVYIPNLMDHSAKVLDTVVMNTIINEAIPDLPDNTKQVIVYYIDIDDPVKVEKFIADHNETNIKIELRDLKEILDLTVTQDKIEYILSVLGESRSELRGENVLTTRNTKTITKNTKIDSVLGENLSALSGKENITTMDTMNSQSSQGYEIEITKFISERLNNKIDEYNQKKSLNDKKSKQLSTEDIANEDNEEIEEVEVSEEETQTEKKKKKEFKPIVISEDGIELIEMISIDYTNNTDIWQSDYEIKIDKNGYLIDSGKKTKTFWNGKIKIDKKPLRMKIRNIAGDESIIDLYKNDSITEVK